MHYGPAWTCSSGGTRSSYLRETSSFRIHRTPGVVRFCCRADPLGSRLASGHSHHGEGTFLSVVHCQQPSCSLRHPEKSMPMNPTVALSFSIMGNNHLQTCLRNTMNDVEALKREAGIKMSICKKWDECRTWNWINCQVYDS